MILSSISVINIYALHILNIYLELYIKKLNNVSKIK